MHNNLKTKINVADDVIAIISGISATSIEGVKSLGEGITLGAINFLGTNKLKKGIQIEKDDNGDLSVLVSLVIKDGYNLQSVVTKVQEKIKESIEQMLDIAVRTVKVRVVKLDEKK